MKTTENSCNRIAMSNFSGYQIRTNHSRSVSTIFGLRLFMLILLSSFLFQNAIAQSCGFAPKSIGVNWSFEISTDPALGTIQVFAPIGATGYSTHSTEVNLDLVAGQYSVSADFSGGWMTAGGGSGIVTISSNGKDLSLSWSLPACSTLTGGGLLGIVTISTQDGTPLPESLVEGGVGIILIDDLH